MLGMPGVEMVVTCSADHVSVGFRCYDVPSAARRSLMRSSCDPTVDQDTPHQ